MPTRCRVLQFRGKSWISRAIKAFTWGPYSHTALLTTDSTVIEAWHPRGVREYAMERIPHTPGTQIDVYEIDAPSLDHRLLVRLMREQIGKKYDFRGIGGFLTRRRIQKDDRWFCSELVFAKIARAGVLLLDCPAYKVSPNLITLSPLLRFERTITLPPGHNTATGLFT